MTDHPTQASRLGDAWSRLRAKIAHVVDHPRFGLAITVVIAVNAITLGLETWPRAMAAAGPVINTLDRVALTIFVIEIALKLVAHGPRFFRNGWNVFDFIIVACALVPDNQAFAALRALRILRAMRLLSVVPRMRAVVEGLLGAVPGMGAIVAVLALMFYVASVMATKMYGEAFPDLFGSVGASMFTLFQVMTLEGWSDGIVRPVMLEHPWAWLFFIPFIIVTSFAVLNLFIGLIVNAMQDAHEAEVAAEREREQAAAQDERAALHDEIAALRRDIEALRRDLGR